MTFGKAAALIGVLFLLGACDGDTRPFTEAVEIRTLNLESLSVTTPENTVTPLYLNVNQGMQLGVSGQTFDGDTVALSSGDRTWSVSDTSVASISAIG